MFVLFCPSLCTNIVETLSVYTFVYFFSKQHYMFSLFSSFMCKKRFKTPKE